MQAMPFCSLALGKSWTLGAVGEAPILKQVDNRLGSLTPVAGCNPLQNVDINPHRTILFQNHDLSQSGTALGHQTKPTRIQNQSHV